MVGVRSKKVTQRNSASKCATFFFITVIEKRDCVDSDNGILWVKMHLKTFFRDTENTIVYLFIQSLKTQSNGLMVTMQSPLKTPWNEHWIAFLDCSPFQFVAKYEWHFNVWGYFSEPSTESNIQIYVTFPLPLRWFDFPTDAVYSRISSKNVSLMGMYQLSSHHTTF